MKIICIGLNYRKHAMEMGWPIPAEPVVFLKPDSAILKNNKPFFLPDFSENIHYEVEVVIKISKLGKGFLQNLPIDILMKLLLELILQPVIFRAVCEKRNALGIIQMF